MTRERIKINKTLRTLDLLGVKEELIPEKIKNSAYEISTTAGFGLSLEIGFLLDEDIELVKELSEHIPAVKIVTSKEKLFSLRNETDNNHVGFTHLNKFYEDHIFYCLYVVPADFAFGLKI